MGLWQAVTSRLDTGSQTETKPLAHESNLHLYSGIVGGGLKAAGGTEDENKDS